MTLGAGHVDGEEVGSHERVGRGLDCRGLDGRRGVRRGGWVRRSGPGAGSGSLTPQALSLSSPRWAEETPEKWRIETVLHFVTDMKKVAKKCLVFFQIS